MEIFPKVGLPPPEPRLRMVFYRYRGDKIEYFFNMIRAFKKFENFHKIVPSFLIFLNLDSKSIFQGSVFPLQDADCC